MTNHLTSVIVNIMAKRKKKIIIDKEKSDFYGSVRIGLGRKGQVFKDKSKYSRKKKHVEENDV